jgi:hypothetical protein
MGVLNEKRCKHNCHFLKWYITLFESIDEFSASLNSGSFQFMSSVRVSYLFKPKKSTRMTLGGGKIVSLLNYEPKHIKDFEEEFDMAEQYKENINNMFKEKWVHKVNHLRMKTKSRTPNKKHKSFTRKRKTSLYSMI